MTTPKTWNTATYTEDTWTTLVEEEAAITAIRVSHTGGLDPITVEFRRGTFDLAGVETLEQGEAKSPKIKTLGITDVLPLQFRINGTGATITVDGLVP